MQALIIGAGIAGLATALALEQIGVDATVVERAPAPRAEGSALTLSFNALTAADALGIGGAIRRRSEPIDQVRVADLDDRTIELVRLVAPDHTPLPSYALRRADLLGIVDGARRGSVDYGQTVEFVAATGSGADIRHGAGDVRRYGLVVAADGANSRTRRRLFPGSELRTTRDRCWRFVAPDPRARRDVVEYLGPSRRLGLIPLPGGEVSVFATVRVGRAAPPLGARPAGDLFADFPRPEAAWLVALFSSTACDSCRGLGPRHG